MKIKVNEEDMVLVAEIRAALSKNKSLYGKQYCPCVPEFKYCVDNDQDFVCPCKDFRENVKAGETCHCGLYVKVEE